MQRIVFLVVLAFFGFEAFASAKMPERKTTTLIVVHHSASNAGDVETFRTWHKAKGWQDVGYHYVILQDGTIQSGRKESLRGAHALNGRSFDRNPFSIGICLVATDTFTAEQTNALVNLLERLCRKYSINPEDSRMKNGIQGHHEQCPGQGLDLGEIKQRVTKRLKQ